MVRSKRASDPRHQPDGPQIRKVQPAAPGAQSWLGVLVDPGEWAFSADHTGHFVVVRCVDPCSARGIKKDGEYLVRASFVSDPT